MHLYANVAVVIGTILRLEICIQFPYYDYRDELECHVDSVESYE